MPKRRKTRFNERGATLLEFAIAASVFFMAMFAVLEFGRVLWVHNALTDAARRGARYAVLHNNLSRDEVKNVVVYGDPAGGTEPLVENLSTTNVNVTYSSDYTVSSGTATVSITSYQFNLNLPLLGTTIQMPSYSTTLTGESVGLKPADL
jgi:Flp pilus assembly protein TadG